MSVKSRINEYIKAKNISVRRFEETCGLTYGYVNAMKKGFGVQKLDSVLSKYPDLSREWLLYGEGNMIKDTQQTITINSENVNGVMNNHGTVHFSNMQDAEKEIAHLRSLLEEKEKQIKDKEMIIMLLQKQLYNE